eukprot:CAMPEP_0172429032 /NCGR_PEP_ID=MMETSP1064-20121228/48722_1 /TAXON_ID=202472 /ORGANISM="Aulacoseira subarctica , Strain CCAP 1002/5" /LENGTH=447 /DNA_ID=CAMNT_0013174151 /DNA_START=82 /DNA_END=1422 /DNA_ORIENTATION=+
MESSGAADSFSSDLSTLSLTIFRRRSSAGIPIEQQYQINFLGLTAFDKTYKEKMWVLCYQIGRAFVATALWDIPTHGYYNSERHKEDRLRNTFESLRVAELLIRVSEQIPEAEQNQVKEKLSFYDGTNPQLEVEARCLFDEAKKLADDETLQNYYQLREKLLQEADENISYTSSKDDIQENLKSLAQSGFFHSSISSFSSFRNDSQTTASNLSWQNLSYPTLDDVTQDFSKNLEREHFFQSIPIPVGALGRQRSNVFPVKIMQQQLWEDWQALKNEGKIIFSAMSTFQGKYPSSTNGCTVIAPLLVMHHLFGDGHGIADAKIDEVIDKEAAAILPQVRSQLGLTKDALIIPSDVHDYMIKEGYFNQDQFAGVCGGNITNEEDINKIHSMLDENGKNKGKKLAAALFFHGHVIAILKTNFPDGRISYDVIDSLPSALTITGTKDESGW